MTLYVRVLPSKSAKLERRRAEKRLADAARHETGCKIRSIGTFDQTLGLSQPRPGGASNLSFCGVTLAASPPHPTPYMFGGAGISEQHQTPLCGPARDRLSAPRDPLLHHFWLRGAILEY